MFNECKNIVRHFLPVVDKTVLEDLHQTETEYTKANQHLLKEQLLKPQAHNGNHYHLQPNNSAHFGSDDVFLLQTTEQEDTDGELALGLHPEHRASKKRASHHGAIYLKHDNIWAIL